MVKLDENKAVAMSKHKMDEVIQGYMKWFSLKVKAPEVVIGFAMFPENGVMHMVAESHVKFEENPRMLMNKFRFQHWRSCAPRVALINVLMGQCYRTIDSTNNEEGAVRLLTKLYIEFWMVGFPIRAVAQTCVQISVRHPYLKMMLRERWRDSFARR